MITAFYAHVIEFWMTLWLPEDHHHFSRGLLSQKIHFLNIITRNGKVTSPVMGLISATRKVIDSANIPVLVIRAE